jgi:hypothetical protein
VASVPGVVSAVGSSDSFSLFSVLALSSFDSGVVSAAGSFVYSSA